MKKYDIEIKIIDSRSYVKDEIIGNIKYWLHCWRNDNNSPPKETSMKVGIEIYDILKEFKCIGEVFGNIFVYDVQFFPEADWSVKPNYLEIKLK